MAISETKVTTMQGENTYRKCHRQHHCNSNYKISSLAEKNFLWHSE